MAASRASTSIGSLNTARGSTSARSTLIGLAVTIALLRAADGSTPPPRGVGPTPCEVCTSARALGELPAV